MSITWGTSPEDMVGIPGRMNGQIFLIRGNHEKVAEYKPCVDRFVWGKDYFGPKIGEQKIYLCHYAFRTRRKKGSGTDHDNS